MRVGALAVATGTTAKTLPFYEQAGLPADPLRTSCRRSREGAQLGTGERAQHA
ncbi:hypothetical protein AB0G54_39780 [Streptomyces yokosukanensis]|uniref:hypothetical protein n=1 Tax=Streptomyces yokosukanensis TaxID=67386 RepID=UPI00131DC450|nr:hypothetical protein [Streptomyces yokosukanensis]